MRAVLGAAAAGLALALSFPPTGWAAFAVPAVAVFLGILRALPSRRLAWGSGAAFGVAYFGALFPWIGELGLVALIPLVLTEAAFTTVYAGVLHRFREVSPVRWYAVAVGGWALAELVRERFPLGGFPWGMLGYTVAGSAPLREAARWIGTSGWSVLLAAAAAGLVVAAEGARSRDVELRFLAAPLLVAGALAVLTDVVPAGPDGREIRVAVVQGNAPCLGYHCAGEREATYRAHLALTRSLTRDVDLVVWPESANGGGFDPTDPAVAADMAGEARRLGAVLLAGGDRVLDEETWVNENVVFGPDGEIVGVYRKRHPVPFGEYVPARDLFGWIDALAAVPRDMVPGDGPVVFDTPAGDIGSVISFESSFSRYSRETVLAGADLLVVATSQASYPFSAASDQLIGMTRMRSAELGVDVVHAARTGRSALLVDGGDVAAATPLAVEAVLVGTVRLRDDEPTLYARWGDWAQLLAVGAGAAAAVGGSRRPMRPRAPRSERLDSASTRTGGRP